MTARLLPIGLITLVFNLGGGLVAPALPLYARSLGADYRDLGLIGAAHGLAFAALTIPLGRASDRFGRRAILMLSGIGIGGAAALYLAAGGVPGLAAGKLLEAAAWAAFWPTLEAWVAERFGARAGAAMGVAYGAYALAFVVGTSVGGFVVEAFGLRAPFVLYLGTAGALGDPRRDARGRRDGGARGRPPPRGRDAADRHDGPGARRGPGARSRTRRASCTSTGSGPSSRSCRCTGRTARSRRDGSGSSSPRTGSRGSSAPSAPGACRTRSVAALVLVPAMLVTGAGAGLVVAPLGTGALFLGAMALGLAAGASAPTCIALIADHVSAADRGIAMGLFEAACGVSILASGLIGGFAAEASRGRGALRDRGGARARVGGGPRPRPPSRPRLTVPRPATSPRRPVSVRRHRVGPARHRARPAATATPAGARTSRGAASGTRAAPRSRGPCARGGGSGISGNAGGERRAGSRGRSGPRAARWPSGSRIAPARWSSSRSWRAASSRGSWSSAGAPGTRRPRTGWKRSRPG